MTALRLCPLVVFLMLAACGDSGNSDPSASTNLQSAPTPPQPMSVAPTTLTGTVSGDPVTLELSETPNTGTATFAGQVAETGDISLSVLEGNTPVVSQTVTGYYLTDPYTPLGLSLTVNGVSEQVRFSSINLPPATLTVGSSGPLTSGVYYAADGVTVIGSIMETYSVTANDPTSVKYSVTATGTVNGTPTSETDVYTVSASGSVALIEVDLLLNGQTVQFTAGS